MSHARSLPRRPLGPVAAGLVALALTGCHGGRSAAASSASTPVHFGPTTTDAGGIHEVPTTSPPVVTVPAVASALRARGLAVCDDASEGASGNVSTESISEHHWRFGTNSASACDTSGVGHLTFRQYPDDSTARQAVDTFRGDHTYLAAFQCGLMVVTFDDTVPSALRAPAAAAISAVPGCHRRFGPRD